jgi:hypothetical protein
VKRPALQHRPLTIAEVAEYLGYRTTAGIRGLVKKKQLKTCGRGARDQHLFDLQELDLFKRNRGLAYAARKRECHPKPGCSSPCREASGAPKGDDHHALGEWYQDEISGSLQPERRDVPHRRQGGRSQDRAGEVQGEIHAGGGSRDDTERCRRLQGGADRPDQDRSDRNRTPTRIPRLETLCRSSWITFVTENVNSEDRAAKLSRVIETHILKRWGSYFIDKITVPEIDAWVRDLTTNYSPETIRHHVGLFRRILGKARGQYQLMPIDWDLITLPAVTNEHAMKNRLNVEQIAIVLPIIVEQYPFYAPMIFALYTLGLRYCHVAALRWNKLDPDGVIAIEETYDVSANVFSPVDQRKKAPPVIALEPRTLDLVSWHRR